MNKAADSKGNTKQKAASITMPMELTESEKQAQLSFDFAERTYNKEFSQYIVYVDESGDSNLKLENIDSGYPVFVLALCIFHFEARGENEDTNLELEFRRICDGDNAFKIPLPFEILIKSKQTNSTGLQFADLVARPIGRHLIDGKRKNNRAFNVLEKKFFCQDRKRLGEEYLGYGLATFPPLEKAKGPGNRSHDADQGTPQST